MPVSIPPMMRAIPAGPALATKNNMSTVRERKNGPRRLTRSVQEKDLLPRKLAKSASDIAALSFVHSPFFVLSLSPAAPTPAPNPGLKHIIPARTLRDTPDKTSPPSLPSLLCPGLPGLAACHRVRQGERTDNTARRLRLPTRHQVAGGRRHSAGAKRAMM